METQLFQTVLTAFGVCAVLVLVAQVWFRAVKTTRGVQ